MERSVVHIDMNTFFVSCERLTNSALNGITLIIGAKEVWLLPAPMKPGDLGTLCHAHSPGHETPSLVLQSVGCQKCLS